MPAAASLASPDDDDAKGGRVSSAYKGLQRSSPGGRMAKANHIRRVKGERAVSHFDLNRLMTLMMLITTKVTSLL